MLRIALLLAEGFEEVEAMTPTDLLRRAGIDLTIAGVASDCPTGSHGVRIAADTRIEELDTSLDGVILPGGLPGAVNLGESPRVRELCRTLMDNGALVAAICAAPALALAPFGLLEGKKFTCYPGFQDKVSDAFYTEEDVVIDGNVITSRGVGTAARFSLELIRYLLSGDKADEIARSCLLL